MKKKSGFILVALFALAIVFISVCKAQDGGCEKTRMGTLIVKNTVSKTVHVKDPSHPISIHPADIDSSHGPPTMRVCQLSGDSILTLRYLGMDPGGECNYMLELTCLQKTLRRFYLNANGEIKPGENSASMPDKFVIRKYQPDIDAFLKHFD